MNILFKKKFSNEEMDTIFQLSKQLASTDKISLEKPSLFVTNISRRMHQTRHGKLKEYLNFALHNQEEYQHLVSSLTIHTTQWFREVSHFEFLEKYLKDSDKFKGRTINVFSMGCSTGEEVYSLALVLEFLSTYNNLYGYHIFGVDIDPISINKAKNAIYSANDLKQIPLKYRKNVLVGTDETNGLLTLTKKIREKCHFYIGNAIKFNDQLKMKFDVIFCRNMLIYFNSSAIDTIIENLIGSANQECMLFLGHSESINQNRLQLKRLAASVFQYKAQDLVQTVVLRNNIYNEKQASQETNEEILILDDSKTIQTSLKQTVESSGYQTCIASRLSDAAPLLENKKIGLILLDLNLPDGRGDEWLIKQRSAGLEVPCIIITGSSPEDVEKVLDTLGQSAQDVFLKDQLNTGVAKLQARINCIMKNKSVSKFKPRQPVVVVDDDVGLLEMYKDILEEKGYFVKTFQDPIESIDFIKNNPCHCILVDYKMPKMDGEKLAQKLNTFLANTPIIMISGVSTNLKKLEKNKTIYRVLEKPISRHKVHSAVSDALLAKYSGELQSIDFRKIQNCEMILIGTSTGGPQVLNQILSRLSNQLPPILVVQHIQEQFQRSFAQNLASNAGLICEIVEKPTLLEKGHIYFASPDHHIELQHLDGKIKVMPTKFPPYKSHRPSVNNLFKSAAHLSSKIDHKKILAILLTGMGDDGAEGMTELHKRGAYTIAQNMQNCTVFGMPRVAIDLCGVSAVSSIEEIRSSLLKLVKN